MRMILDIVFDILWQIFVDVRRLDKRLKIRTKKTSNCRQRCWVICATKSFGCIVWDSGCDTLCTGETATYSVCNTQCNPLCVSLSVSKWAGRPTGLPQTHKAGHPIDSTCRSADAIDLIVSSGDSTWPVVGWLSVGCLSVIGIHCNSLKINQQR